MHFSRKQHTACLRVLSSYDRGIEALETIKLKKKQNKNCVFLVQFVSLWSNLQQPLLDSVLSYARLCNLSFTLRGLNFRDASVNFYLPSL